MAYVAGESTFSRAAEEHAAELLAQLHDVTAPRFGLEKDTLIGGLHQPNSPQDDWVAYFRDLRLRHMANAACKAGRLPTQMRDRLERLAGKLDTWLRPPKAPSLLHGDVWTTNVLSINGRITAFIDPAIYFGHPEIELAFIKLFDTFGRSFFSHYAALRGLEPGFNEERKDLYNLYPLLVHVRLFGGSYVVAVDRILRRFGF
jgi:fructosamine-3-kinase